ncbi:MAG: response regulator [Candidatus Wolfebacteria bacterium]|nr:response regulator [Candidatus Wolfebacteria bacterium]
MKKSLLVYVVDDKEEVLMMVKALLRELGHRPIAFSDPLKALADFLKQAQFNSYPDLVISDYEMPGITGDVLVWGVKEFSNGNVATILMSGLYPPTYTHDGAAFTRSNADAFLSKPFSLGDIEKAIQEIFPELTAVG